MRKAALLAVLASLAAVPARAISPIMACDDVVESGMVVRFMQALGPQSGRTGVVAEAYGNARVLENGVEVSRPPPVPELEGFQGTRIMSCATGEFLALNRQGLNDVVTAMTATEFLRDKVRAGEPVAFSELRQAAEALYGPVLVLRETGQTCACEAYFDELRPAGQTPYEERTDVER